MHFPRLLVLGAAVLAPVALAHADVRKLSGAEIKTALGGHTMSGEANGRPTTQIFQAGGATYYEDGGNQSQGAWRVTGDQYCSQWPPSESWACYDVLSDGTMLIFVSSRGERSAVKPVN